jgi:hypothetical protein
MNRSRVINIGKRIYQQKHRYKIKHALLGDEGNTKSERIKKSGRYWDRTSGLFGVNEALSR